jgi:hypothetical protein
MTDPRIRQSQIFLDAEKLKLDAIILSKLSYKEILKLEILERNIRDDLIEQEICLVMLDMINYNPNYKSGFDGSSFEQTKDKEYYQALDKIASFFKYGRFYPDDNENFVELPYEEVKGKFVNKSSSSRSQPGQLQDWLDSEKRNIDSVILSKLTDKEILKREIFEGKFWNKPVEQEMALYMLDRIIYNPDYISVFEGVTFENMDDKEYYQARDKISGFFKYNIFHPDDNDSFLELPYHQENFNYFRNENLSIQGGINRNALSKKKKSKLTKAGIRRSHCRLKKNLHK